MRVDYTEELVMNEKSPAYGCRAFRLEYEGDKFEGRIFIPPLIKNPYGVMDRICKLLQGKDG